MKDKSKPNGYPARRRAIQKFKNQFFFLSNKPRPARRASRPLWGIVLIFFALFQACEQKEKSNPEPQSSVVQNTIAQESEPGALLFNRGNSMTMDHFSQAYLMHGYQDDLYLRNRFSDLRHSANASLSDQAVADNAIHD